MPGSLHTVGQFPPSWEGAEEALLVCRHSLVGLYSATRKVGQEFGSELQQESNRSLWKTSWRLLEIC